MKYCSIITAFLLVCITSVLHSQSVLVSEYLNEQPPSEWNEIIVVTDNLDMRGFVVTDNNTNQVMRQGGVKFKNIEFWRHVRAGTVIGIWHRAYPSNAKIDRDTSMSDGRIMLAKEDTDFFEEYKSSAAIVTDAPFNIAIDGDIIEVLDASGNHIHGMGHRVVDPAPGSYWVTMPQPKMNNAVSLQNGQSNRAYPGAKLADYNGNQGDPITQACGTNVTRTLPNKDCSTGASNADFWHLLRIPTWLSPKLTATVSSNKVDLSWNNIIDAYPTDNMQGYIVLRDSGLVPAVPVDGTTYTVGQKIGNAIVVAIQNSPTTTFTDNISIPCGVVYTYRVYAYRFGVDDELGNGADPKTTRGRQYNRDIYAFASVIKQTVQGPKLQTNGAVAFCSGGSVELSTPTQTGLTPQWMYNGVDLPGETTFKLTAKQPGEYRLRLTDAQNCLILSDSVVVTVYALPVCDINPKTYNLCSDSTVALRGDDNTDFTYQWQFNGTDISGATQANYVANKSGSYQIVVKNKNGCSNTTPVAVIKSAQPTFFVSKSNLDFNSLTGCEVSKDDNSVNITNTGTESIFLEKVSEPVGFQLVSPALPVELKPGQPLNLLLRFAPKTTGTSNGNMLFTVNQCGANKTISLMGTAAGGGTPVTLTNALVQFKTLVTCGTDVYDTSFVEITASGAEDVTLTSRSIAPDNKIVDFTSTVTFPYTIKAGTTKQLPLHFSPVADISYVRDITLPYKTNSCSGDLKISTRGIRTTPYLEVHAPEVNFGTLDSCNILTKDTTIIVKNSSKVDVEIQQLILPMVQIVKPPISTTLKIPAGDSMEITLRFTPIGYMALPQTSNIAFNGVSPCSFKSETFTLKGERIGGVVSLTKQSIPLNDINRCSSIPMTDSFDINIGAFTWPDHNAVRLVDIIPGSSSIIIDKNKFIYFERGFTTVKVQYIPNSNSAIGPFKDSLRLIFDPCQRERIIYFTGNYVQADLEVGPTFTKKDTSMVFDTIEVNTTARQKFIVKNTGNTSMTTASILNNIADPFYVVGATPPLGSQLKIGESMEIEIEYRPSTTGTHTGNGILVVTQPCSDAATITLSGNSKPPIIPPVPFHFVIADSLKAQPGESIDIPIYIVGSGIQGKHAKEINPVVEFNQTLLKVNTITTGSALTGYTSSFTVSNSGNKQQINITALGDSITSEGIAFVMNCEALLGDELTTPLIIDSANVKVISSEVYITKCDDGTFTLYGECIVNKTLTVKGNVSLSLNAPNPIKENSDVILSTVGTQPAKLSVFNELGQEVTTLLDATITAGYHSVQWNVQDLPQGYYFLTLTSGISKRVLRVIVLH
ncbi:MAG: choice-of-anchor D domain-containing protein [Candidatus Kapaibacterium sp.]